jgi:hypothetical protein
MAARDFKEQLTHTFVILIEQNGELTDNLHEFYEQASQSIVSMIRAPTDVCCRRANHIKAPITECRAAPGSGIELTRERIVLKTQ